MTTYYVGAGGNDSNNGTTWALRKLTLNGAEDIPVQAGDTVYVGAGTYREELTCDVNGSSGSPITYIGDYDGSHTDGTGGVVRITGSDNDKTAVRQNCIYDSGKNYRTFQGFQIDTTTGKGIYIISPATGITLKNMYIGQTGQEQVIYYPVPDNFELLIDGCYFASQSHTSLHIYASEAKVATSAIISNCIFFANNSNFGVRFDYVGDVVVRNNTFLGAMGVRVQSAQASGHPIIVNNNIFLGVSSALYAVATGMITEDYNTFYQVATARTNVQIGAHSLTYPMLPDTRWFFELVNGGSMLTPFDFSSASQLINVAGTSPTTADMRGTTVQGAEREWGALEYDSTLDIEAGTGTGGGAVSIQPYSGRISL